MCQGNINRLCLARPQPGTWPSNQARALTQNGTGGTFGCRMMPNALRQAIQGSI